LLFKKKLILLFHTRIDYPGWSSQC